MHKNKFLTFIFSTIPGCGHMYLGYMKRGAEFMMMFAASIYLAILFTGFRFRLEVIGVIFMILIPIIWFYQMFDAMHAISQMRRFGIEYPDDDGFFIPGISNVTNLNALSFFKKRKVVRTIAIILMCIGVYVLFLNMSNGIYSILYNTANSYMKEQFSKIYHTIMNYVPSVVISLLLILGGIKLLSGNNQNDKNNENEDGGE